MKKEGLRYLDAIIVDMTNDLALLHLKQSKKGYSLTEFNEHQATIESYRIELDLLIEKHDKYERVYGNKR